MSNIEYSGTINELLGTTSIYDNKLTIQEGKLVYIEDTVSSQEEKWLEQLGIDKANEYFTVEFDFGENEQKITKTVEIGKTVDIPEVNNSLFKGWYYLKESGSEDDPTYTEMQFDAANTPITKDIYIYAKYYNDAVMRARNTSVSFWKAAYRPYITDIIFTSESSDIPSTYEEVTNIRADSDAADIMAYIENTSVEDIISYRVTIYSPSTIYANVDSKHYFENFTSLKNIDFSNFNTSKTQSMYNMFYNNTSLTSLDLSNFNVSNVKTMYRMFYYCKQLVNLDLSDFYTNKLTNMQGMFYGCTKLKSINLSNFNTSLVLNMKHVFYNCNALESLDINHFDTKKVRYFDSIFYGCSTLTELDISNFDTKKATTMTSMFRKCSKLAVIYVGENWTTENASTGEMFTNCKVKQVTLKTD